MSTSLAIAATTQTLRMLLNRGLTEDSLVIATNPLVNLTTLPPDRARASGSGGPQLNLYLYQTTIDPAWRNTNPNGKDGLPPLGLNLHYLVTAYGDDGFEVQDQQVFGSAMRTLNDYPLLDRSQIAVLGGTNGIGAKSELHLQLERVRLSLLPMSLEELSKLWMTFQTPYRISIAFEASVVLIDGRRTLPSALPVTSIGKDQRGPIMTTDRFPSLTEIEAPFRQNAVRLGESFTVRGRNLALDNLKAQLERIIPGDPNGKRERKTLPITERNAESIKLTLPATLPNWGPGFYALTVTAEPIDALHPISSNTLSLPLAPSITLNPTTLTNGNIDLKVTCHPGLLKDQQVLLLFGDQQIRLKSNNPTEATGPNVVPAATDSLEFLIEKSKFPTGTYTVRLRVDGVDSIPVAIGANKLELDQAQQLKIP